MSSQNPEIYYQNEENHGDYVYESLENIVNNFMQNQTGDNTIIGTFPRSRILYWAKKGLQQLNFEVLKEVKAVELELGDTLDIILPPDYVNYVRVSWSTKYRRFISIITINKKYIYLGSFKDEELAKKAYEKALDNISLYNNNNSEFKKILKKAT